MLFKKKHGHKSDFILNTFIKIYMMNLIIIYMTNLIMYINDSLVENLFGL